MSKKKRNDQLELPTPSPFLESMFKESEVYSSSSIELIETLAEREVGFQGIPLQPLYMALKKLPLEEVGSFLTKFSPEQRQLMLDIDLWERDELDLNEFEFWVRVYGGDVEESLRSEFSQSMEFLMYLKGRFNIWTFDTEDPQYPDHDFYFLTDDSLLLFEFHRDFPLLSQVRSLIRELYSQLGVEKAYSWLFKIISEGPLNIIEEEYQRKKSRLGDLGFVDYFDALEIENPHINRKMMDHWVQKKEKVSVGVDSFSQQQILPRGCLLPFKEEFFDFDEELSKLRDEKRREYLRFNFLRLVNGNITLQGSLRDGGVALVRAGEKTKHALSLGLSYLADFSLSKGHLLGMDEQGLFNLFDFTEVYRLGRSLLLFGQKELKKSLRQSKIEDEESFVGQLIGDFLDQSFDDPCKYSSTWVETPQIINSYSLYESWMEKVTFVSKILPYIGKLFEGFVPLRSSGKIQDHFYLNYNSDDIDFEAILISSFANFVLVEKGELSQKLWDEGKLGLTRSEYLKFISFVLDSHMKVHRERTLFLFKGYCSQFGLDEISLFEDYFLQLLEVQLEGYDYPHLDEKDYAHVGGGILLKEKLELH